MKRSSPSDILVTTLHWVPNFGANLQAYAVSHEFKKLGRNVRFVNFRPAELEEMTRSSVGSSQLKAHSIFVESHLEETPLIRNQTDFEALIEDSSAETLITGSDAVFRLKPDSSRADFTFPNPFWLSSNRKNSRLSKCRKFALAPSAMGTDFRKLDNKTKSRIKDALMDFDLVTARDDWTIQQLKSIGISKNVENIPDPVFLLYDTIQSHKSDPSGNPYFVVSSGNRLSTKWLHSFTEISNKEGFDVMTLPIPEGHTSTGGNQSIDLPLDPLNWLALIAKSSGYIGIRFHPILIALCTGLPTLSLDLYHSSFLDKNRSKTALLMKQFDCERYCIGKLEHRFLSPKSAYKMLMSQKELQKAKTSLSGKLAEQIRHYLLTIANATSTHEQPNPSHTV